MKRLVTGPLCHWSDVIPMKFPKHSGIRDHQFMIKSACPLQKFSDMPGWPCTVLKDSEWTEVYLPYKQFPNEVEALAILSTLDGESEREGRYIKMHAAYEAVVSQRETDCSAIRHFLVHPIARLTRPKVRRSLAKRFGSHGPDLRQYYHQKEFYRCIGQMLIAIDNAVHSRILSEWRKVIIKET